MQSIIKDVKYLENNEV